jgi:hypothetical protein
VEAARSIKFVQGMLAVSNITVAFCEHPRQFRLVKVSNRPQLAIRASSMF